MGCLMGDVGACGNSSCSAVNAPPQRQAPAKVEETLVEPAKKRDSAEISDAARAQLASERRQEQSYAAQLLVSQNQSSIAG